MNELWRVHTRTQIVVSSIGRIKKSSGKETFGTLRRGKYYVKKNGVRECVGRLVLEAHAPNRLGNHEGKGVVIWGTGESGGATDTQNNNITNLHWELDTDGWTPDLRDWRVDLTLSMWVDMGREAKAGKDPKGTSPYILQHDAYKNPENYGTFEDLKVKYTPEMRAVIRRELDGYT